MFGLNFANGLEVLNNDRFIRLGRGLGHCYFNFKLKGKHYFKGFWVDFNGPDRVIIRLDNGRYKNISISKIEKIDVYFFGRRPFDLKEKVEFDYLVQLIENYSSSKGYIIFNSDYELRFKICHDKDSMISRQIALMNGNYNEYCVLEALSKIDNDELISDIFKSYSDGKDYVFKNKLGVVYVLKEINNMSVSEFFKNDVL